MHVRAFSICLLSHTSLHSSSEGCCCVLQGVLSQLRHLHLSPHRHPHQLRQVQSLTSWGSQVFPLPGTASHLARLCCGMSQILQSICRVFSMTFTLHYFAHVVVPFLLQCQCGCVCCIIYFLLKMYWLHNACGVLPFCNAMQQAFCMNV